jgi:hypothetical protein
MIDVRKTQVSVEEIFHERGPRLDAPLRVGTALAVVANPFAGRYESDLVPFMEALHQLGATLAERLVEVLGGAEKVEAYGKGAVVGEDGELEHGALWHEAGGHEMRRVLDRARAIVPAAKTVGGVGCRLMIPLGHVQAAYVRSHFGVAEMTVWDAPRRDEIVYGMAMATGPRVHARSGGLQVADIEGQDGLR